MRIIKRDARSLDYSSYIPRLLDGPLVLAKKLGLDLNNLASNPSYLAQAPTLAVNPNRLGP